VKIRVRSLPLGLLFWGLAIVLARTIAINPGLYSILTYGFLLLAPGMVLIRFLPFSDALYRIPFSIALSLVINSTASLWMISTRNWRPTSALDFMIILSIIGAFFSEWYRQRSLNVVANRSSERRSRLTSNLGDSENAIARLGKGAAKGIVFSPRHNTLAVVTSLGVYLQNPELSEKFELLRNATLIDHLTFSPDGRLLAGRDGNRVVIWDVATLKELTILKTSAGSAASKIVFSPNGRWLAALSFGEGVKLWNTTTWQLFNTEIGKPLSEWLAFSPDGQMIAVATNSRVELWEYRGRKKIKQIDIGGQIQDIRFSREDLLVAVVGTDKNLLSLWNPGNDERLEIKVEGAINTFSFSPDGSKIAVGLADREIHILDTSDWQVQNALENLEDDITRLTFSEDGSLLACLSRGGTINVYEAQNWNQTHTIEEFKDAIDVIAWSPKGDYLASSSRAGYVNIWQPGTGAMIHSIRSNTPFTFDLDWSQDGELLASGSIEGPQIWRARSGDLVHSRGETRPGSTFAVAFSPDGSLLAASNNQKLELLDSLSWRSIAQLEGHTGNITCTAFSRNGELLASGGENEGAVFLWDTQTCELRLRLQGRSHQIDCLAFSRNGEMLATAAENSIDIWDTQSWSAVTTIQHPAPILGIDFSPGDGLIAVASGTQVTTYETFYWQARNVFSGHSRQVNSVLFSPQGDLLASGSLDGTIVLWNARDAS
jgi:WD40 repeat protein